MQEILKFDGTLMNPYKPMTTETTVKHYAGSYSIDCTEGRLDGHIILRFSHATEKRGGVEQYLADINKTLLDRNKITIIQLHLPDENSAPDCSTELLGRGNLIKIPMMVRRYDTKLNNHNKPHRMFLLQCVKDLFRDWVVYNPVFGMHLKKFFVKKAFSRYNREPMDAGRKTREILSQYKVSLIVIHLAGGFGCAEVIKEALGKSTPYLILNHFSNSWFKRVGFREQVTGAAGVGGVSSRDVPRYLKGRYQNIGDGVDTEFFVRMNSNPVIKRSNSPIVILPARVVPGKGHKDLIRAISLLKLDGIGVGAVIAGREDIPRFRKELKELAEQENVADQVDFIGELTQEKLRDWYAASFAAVLPSYSEGLGRILLEAQAMELPVLAYAAGGIRDALVDGITGHLIRKGDVKGLAGKLKELILEPDRGRLMGKAGREFVEDHFSLKLLAQRHEDWYLSAIRKRNVSI
jgi:glycosyltransferase involved in cell wall biosynthesis